MRPSMWILVGTLITATWLAAEEPEHFQGHFLRVKLGGRNSEIAQRHDAHGQLWRLVAGDDQKRNIAGKLVVEFSYDQEVLGELQSVQIVANPVKGEEWDLTDIWKPQSTDGFKVNTANAVTQWMHIGGGQFSQHVELPTGRYMLHLSIMGSKTWDRQSIWIEVE